MDGEIATSNYDWEERTYALDQIRRIARMMNVTDHIYLNEQV